jgi:aryl-alcohol dehydrogenase-like predicted oxidoreductase
VPLSNYRPLGRSGLIVSPFALGTMTFGVARWGMGRDDAEAVFDVYVEAGGNLIDTADVYAGGGSETGLREAEVFAGSADQLRSTFDPHGDLPYSSRL